MYIPPNKIYKFPNNHFILNLQNTITHSNNQNTKSNNFKYNYHQKNKTLSLPLLQPNKYSIQFTKPKSPKLLKTFNHFNLNQNNLIHISNLTYSSITKNILITNYNLNKILTYSKSKNYHKKFIYNYSIHNITITTHKSILLTINHTNSTIIKKYKYKNNIITSYNSFYKYKNPFNIYISKIKKIIISNLQHNNIHIFTKQKKPSFKFNSKNNNSNHFLLPYYITINNQNNIIISNNKNHKLKIHKNNNTILHIIKQQNSQNKKFFYPQNIFINKHNNIYITNTNNFKIQIFSPKKKYLSTPIKNTYKFNINIKPTNIIIINNHLIITLHKTHISLLQIYN